MGIKLDELDPYVNDLVTFIEERSALKGQSPHLVLATLLTTAAVFSKHTRKPGMDDKELFTDVVRMFGRAFGHVLRHTDLTTEDETRH